MKPADDTPLADEPAVARVPWNPWFGVLFIVLVFIMSQFIVGQIFSIYPYLQHWTISQAQNWVDNSVVIEFIYTLAVEALIISAIYLFIKHASNAGLAVIGLKRPAWLDPLYGLAAVLPYYIFYGIMLTATTHFIPSLNVNQSQNIGFGSVHGNGQLILTFISLAVLPPIAEEIMVRGFLYSSLKKALPTLYAVLLTSALFALPHLFEGGDGGLLWIAGLDTFTLSLVLIYLREKTGSLWPCITLHAVKNSVAFATLFVLHAR